MASAGGIRRTVPQLSDPTAVGRIQQTGQAFAGIARGIEGEIAAYKQAEESTKTVELNSQYQRDSENFFQDFQVQAAGDPFKNREKFEIELKNRGQKYLQSAPSGGRSFLQQQFTKQNNRYLQRYDDFSRTQRVKNFDASIKKTLDNHRLSAFNLGQEGNARGSEPLQDLLGQMSSSFAAASTYIPKNLLEETKSEALSDIIEEHALGMIESRPAAVLNDIASKQYNDVLALDRIKHLKQKATAQINRKNSQEKEAVRSDYRQVVRSLNEGIVPHKEATKRVRDQASSLGMKKVVKDLDLKLSVQDSLQDFLAAPLSEQVGMLDTSRKGAKAFDEKGLEEVRQFRSALQAKKKAIDNDKALEYYAQIGVIRPVQGITPDNPASISEALHSRASAQEEIFAHDGVQVPIISRDEARSMTDFYRQLPVADKAQYIMQLSAVDEEYLPMMGQVFSKATGNKSKHASVGALVSIAQDAPSLVEEAIAGADTERFFSEKDLRSFVRDNLSGAVLDEAALQEMASFVGDVYSNRARSLGRSEQSVIDEDVLEEIQKEAFGEVMEIGSSMVLPFRQQGGDFIDEDDFQDLLEGIDVEELPKTPYINGRPVTNDEFQDMLDDYSLVTVGDGLYQIRNPYNELLVLSDQDGKVIELDLKAADRESIALPKLSAIERRRAMRMP